MALSKSTITGRVPLPTDENLQFAELTFALSGLDTEGASVLPGGISTRIVLIDSDIPPGFELWQNMAGLHGTHYRVLARWTVKDRDGIRDQYADLGVIQIGSDPSYTLADLINNGVAPAIGTFWSAITQAQYDAVIQSAADAAASAVSAALYDGPRFGTIALMQAGTGFADGKFIRVDQAANGEQEGFVYDAASTLTADGALIVDATGMGVGRLISTRTSYASWAELDADVRTLAAGTALSVRGVGDYEVVSSGEHLTTTGGLKVIIIDDVVTPQHYGAAGSAGTDAPAFVSLFANHLNIRIPWRLAEYNLGATTVSIRTGQNIVSEGATVIHTDDTATMFRANAVTDWSLIGPLYLNGLLVSADETTETGLRITGCRRYNVSGVSAKEFKGQCFLLDGASVDPNETGQRGDKGMFSHILGHRSTRGLKIADGGAAEYCNWTLFEFSRNTLAMEIDAGNQTFTSGNVVDNTAGILLTGVGVNNGHGIFTATNINHNTTYNLKTVDVNRGYTFADCHLYGNGSSSGHIWFLNSCGIKVDGGHIDGWIYNDIGSGTRAGVNRITNAYLPTNYNGYVTRTELKTNDSGLGLLELSGNWTKSGAAAINDGLLVRASRGTSAQALTSGVATTLVFNSAADKKGLLNLSTGDLTMHVSGIVRIGLNARINATSGLTQIYALVYVNGVGQTYIAGAVTSGTLGFASGNCALAVDYGDVIKIAMLADGVSPSLAITTSRMTAEMLT
jgi:hypothetical protein